MLMFLVPGGGLYCTAADSQLIPVRAVECVHWLAVVVVRRRQQQVPPLLLLPALILTDQDGSSLRPVADCIVPICLPALTYRIVAGSMPN